MDKSEKLHVAIIGSRAFDNYNFLHRVFHTYYPNPENIEYIVSGGAIGVDTLAEQLAQEHNIKTLIFKPDYDRYKRMAPLMRNNTIVKVSDVVLALWDGKSRGTKYTIDLAMKSGKGVIIEHIFNKAPDQTKLGWY